MLSNRVWAVIHTQIGLGGRLPLVNDPAKSLQ